MRNAWSSDGCPTRAGLFRTAGVKKLADFLSRDFRQAPNRAAAAKNAFVLLGQHRYELAAVFFILGAGWGLRPYGGIGPGLGL